MAWRVARGSSSLRKLVFGVISASACPAAAGATSITGAALCAESPPVLRAPQPLGRGLGFLRSSNSLSLR